MGSLSVSDTLVDVVICRQGNIDARVAGRLVPGQLAVLTHLPTGTDVVRPTLRIPPGGSTPARQQGAGDRLLLVMQGEARVRWGPALDTGATAASGDLVFIPAGVRHLAENPDSRDALQLLVLQDGSD